MNICIIRVGMIVEGLISIITLGRGKDIAQWIATKLGYSDCGCESRRIYLDGLFGCKEKKIKF